MAIFSAYFFNQFLIFIRIGPPGSVIHMPDHDPGPLLVGKPAEQQIHRIRPAGNGGDDDPILRCVPLSYHAGGGSPAFRGPSPFLLVEELQEILPVPVLLHRLGERGELGLGGLELTLGRGRRAPRPDSNSFIVFLRALHLIR